MSGKAQRDRLRYAIAGYFSVGAVLGLVNTFLFPAQARAAVAAAYVQRGYTGARLQTALDAAVDVGRVGAVVLGSMFLGVAIATVLTRASWVLVIDFLLLLLGAFGGINAVVQVAHPADNRLPGQPWLNLVLSFIAVVLAGWMALSRLSSSEPREPGISH